jgi:signal transduction histidine kinase
MQGFGELLEREAGHELNERCRDFVRRIRSSAERMDALIRDALNYSKIAREQFQLVPVCPTRLLRGIVESYPEFEPHRSKIEIQENMPKVLGNQAAMTQCFSNLLNNAIKFARPNTAPHIRVWGESRNGFVRLWFEDNGVGIPAEYHDRLFKMFQRLNGHQEGTGIGLAIVRKAIERQGGKVGLESEPGNGSRFWVELKKAA